MNKKFLKKQKSFILCMMLAASFALAAAGCGGGTDKENSAASTSEQDTSNKTADKTEADSDSKAEKEADTQTDVQVVGEGSTQFDFTVTDQDGNETQFEVHTGKETVGEALQELDLIDGDDGEYGLYVKTVNGITVDYDKDGAYWAFYVNDEYAQTGVDSTEITEGDSYAFKVEKG